MPRLFKIDKSSNGMRIDRWIKHNIGKLPQSLIEKELRKGNIKCKLYENGDDISSHTATNTYKTVQKLLGLDFKTFTQLVYQNTNMSLQFLTATDTNRKKFLIELLKLDEYVEFFEIFKVAARDIQIKINRLDSKSDTIVKWLDENKLDTINILEIKNLPNYSEDDEKQLRQLRNDLEKISEKKKRLTCPQPGFRRSVRAAQAPHSAL